LQEANRAFISVPLIQREHVKIEKPVSQPASESQPATVISFPQLKEAPQPQKPERLTRQQYAELTITEKRELFLTALRSGMIREGGYDKLMVMLGLVKNSPADKILDLENDEILDDIAILWSVNVGAEELTAFLSALRDCDDSFRQKDILDKLITKIFHETQQCGMTEEEWRLRVERKLPQK
jgi:hypothetical protein